MPPHYMSSYPQMGSSYIPGSPYSNHHGRGIVNNSGGGGQIMPLPQTQGPMRYRATDLGGAFERDAAQLERWFNREEARLQAEQDQLQRTAEAHLRAEEEAVERQQAKQEAYLAEKQHEDEWRQRRVALPQGMSPVQNGLNSVSGHSVIAQRNNEEYLEWCRWNTGHNNRNHQINQYHNQNNQYQNNQNNNHYINTNNYGNNNQTFDHYNNNNNNNKFNYNTNNNNVNVNVNFANQFPQLVQPDGHRFPSQTGHVGVHYQNKYRVAFASRKPSGFRGKVANAGQPPMPMPMPMLMPMSKPPGR